VPRLSNTGEITLYAELADDCCETKLTVNQGRVTNVVEQHSSSDRGNASCFACYQMFCDPTRVTPCCLLRQVPRPQRLDLGLISVRLQAAKRAVDAIARPPIAPTKKALACGVAGSCSRSMLWLKDILISPTTLSGGLFPILAMML
jgi:hypothetical protein